LATLDVWFTGLRRDQSEFRRNVPRVQRVRQGERHVLKAAPLIDWTGEDVWNYIREHDVPYNPLYDQSYTSIGCIICTTPTQPWEDRRAGRWRWFNEGTDHQKECGIHTSGSGI
jgi:phosphoadenosine phosphosulfate reductase